MGRRPNPLVVEFFERGAKLPDSSNRYQHACKRCGEAFPKGRLDSLTSHLLRKCPGVTQQDREWVFQQIQQNPERSSDAIKQAAPETHAQDHRGAFGSDAHMSRPMLQQQSALDTLAEVSRHYSSQRPIVENDTDSNSSALNDLTAEQALLSELRGHADLKSPTYPLPSTSSRNHAIEKAPQVPLRSLEPSLPPNITFTASPLVQTASAANQQLELAQNQDSPEANQNSVVDPQLSDVHSQLESHVRRISDIATSGHDYDSRAHIMKWRPATSAITSGAFNYSLMPSDERKAGPGSSHEPCPPKKRGRFDDDRRKQVSDIRKRGACIRCRMLKKPCSGETPCSTCKAVDSARLWKATCLRTRLAEEFTVYSTNLFHARAKIDVSAAVQGLACGYQPVRVDIRFHSRSDLCMGFTAWNYTNATDEVNTSMDKGSERRRSELDRIWILDDREPIADKLTSFVTETLDLSIENEQSTFVKATLQKAQELLRTEENDKAVKTLGEPDKRSSYNLQHELLRNLIELSTLTRLLTGSDGFTMRLQYDKETLPDLQQPTAESTTAETEQASQDIPNTARSYHLIQAQLLASIEARCSKLSKVTINELERRLLQRQQVSRFGTFLASVLLLSCVERMCGLYYSFDTNKKRLYRHHDQLDSQDRQGSIESDSASLQKNDNHPESWPLDMPPLNLWSQGQSFSDLLLMLLRMRALPPQTAESADGKLVVMQSSNGPSSRVQSAVKQDDEQISAGAWLESLDLSTAELTLARDRELSDDGAAESWDMRLVSKLLLPERV